MCTHLSSEATKSESVPIIDYVVFCEIRQLWLTTICRLSANSTKNLHKSDVVYSSIKGLLHPPKYIFFDYSLTCVTPFWILPIERKQRTLFYIRLNARMCYFHSNQSVNTRRIRILALRRMQKRVHCLRSMGNIQNGATLTRRDSFFFCKQKVFSLLHKNSDWTPDGRWTSLAMLFILLWTSTVLFTWQSMGQSQASRFLSKIS